MKSIKKIITLLFLLVSNNITLNFNGIVIWNKTIFSIVVFYIYALYLLITPILNKTHFNKLKKVIAKKYLYLISAIFFILTNIPITHLYHFKTYDFNSIKVNNTIVLNPILIPSINYSNIFVDDTSNFNLSETINNSYKDKQTIVFFKLGCKKCQKVIPELIKRTTPSNRNKIIFIDGNSKKGKQIAKQFGIDVASTSVILSKGKVNRYSLASKENRQIKINFDNLNMVINAIK